MKRIFSLLVVILLVGVPASAQKDENSRIENAGKVMVEILNIPDDIPADLLDKAQCEILMAKELLGCAGIAGQLGEDGPGAATAGVEPLPQHALVVKNGLDTAAGYGVGINGLRS